MIEKPRGGIWETGVKSGEGTKERGRDSEREGETRRERERLGEGGGDSGPGESQRVGDLEYKENLSVHGVPGRDPAEIECT